MRRIYDLKHQQQLQKRYSFIVKYHICIYNIEKRNWHLYTINRVQLTSLLLLLLFSFFMHKFRFKCPRFEFIHFCFRFSSLENHLPFSISWTSKIENIQCSSRWEFNGIWTFTYSSCEWRLQAIANIIYKNSFCPCR